MNRKFTLLLIAAVSTILPAVAVADVMITGDVGVNGTANTAVFQFVPGTNFEAADGSVSWNHYSSGPYMGDLQFKSVSNQTTFIINVMEIQFKADIAPGVFYLNLSVSTPFVDPSYMYLSMSPMSFSDFSYSGLPGATPTIVNPAVTSMYLSDGSQSYGPVSVSGGTVIYIGFFTSAYGTGTLTGETFLSGTYISS